MILNHCFKIHGLILVTTLSMVIGFVSPAFGEETHSYLIGLNNWEVTLLGTLGGGYSIGNGINNAGQVVGYSLTAPGQRHAFITGPNGLGMTDLGTLGGNESYASGINDAGQVVGYSYTAAGQPHAFITGPNGLGMKDLGTLPTLGGLDGSYAYGINDAGQVVGSSFTITTAAGQTEHAFITGPNGVGMTDLGTLGGDYSFVSAASGINDAGQVVGNSYSAVGPVHAFITGPNGVGMTDLNSLAELSAIYRISSAIDINNNGQILVVAGIPEPQSYALMLAGLGLIGFVAWRQKSGSRI